MSDKKDLKFLDEFLNSISKVKGVEGLVLGGSRAKGTHHSGSDFDLGLYYNAESPPDRLELNKVVQRYDDRKVDGLLTEYGEWGPWINGGGWLKIKSAPVDILFRNLNQVNQVIEDCFNGQVSIAYQPGHPHGFVNSIYLAEISLCKVIWESGAVLSSLKKKVDPYPVALKRATIQKFLWEVELSLMCAKKGIPYQDISYVAGFFFRAVSCLNQVIFAVNEKYWMNEKGAVRAAGSFPICPDQYEKKVTQVFSKLSVGRKYTHEGIKVLSQLRDEIEERVRTCSL